MWNLPMLRLCLLSLLTLSILLHGVGVVAAELARYFGPDSIFTDRGGTGGVSLNAKVKTATRELTLDFFRSVFDGTDDPLQRWGQFNKGLLARYVSGGT